MAGTTIARRRAVQGGVRQPMLFLACQLQRRHGMSPTRLGREQSDGDWGGMRLLSAPFYPPGASMPAEDSQVFFQAEQDETRRDSGQHASRIHTDTTALCSKYHGRYSDHERERTHDAVCQSSS
ncbi:hypothetical protein CCMA1212_008261 [Trichoderma ghanense]|uniref:Uncharacterized protein n=1 Tax=Trichoderma ghanense TaxID=65468 RepID=A0ABY2GV33_9HYPO